MSSDILIIGGGILGLNIAKTFALKYPSKSISLIEKENTFG